MKLCTSFLMGDPSLWGALELFQALQRYDDEGVTILLDRNGYYTDKKEVYQNYYTVIHNYFEGIWKKPKFQYEDEVNLEEYEELPTKFILGKWNSKPRRVLPKEDMICYSFMYPNKEMFEGAHFETENRLHDKENVMTLLDYLDGYNLGKTRGDCPTMLARKLDAIQKSKLYIGSYCTWDVIAKTVFGVPTMFVYPNKIVSEKKQIKMNNPYKYFDEKLYRHK